MKAVMWSTFVFPGTGHLYLRKYPTALILIGVSCASLYYLLVKTAENAMQMAEQLQTGNGQIDITSISELASAQSSGGDSMMLNIASLAILACWIIGIVDSYRVGKLQD